MLGSRAFVGDDLRGLGDRRDAAGSPCARRCGRPASTSTAPEARGVDQVAAYLELHIEQGPCLEEADADIGIVTEIVGLVGLEVTLRGAANHAGTTPMDRGATRSWAPLVSPRPAREARSRRGHDGQRWHDPGRAGWLERHSRGLRVHDRRTLARAEGTGGRAFARDLLERVAAEEGLGLEVRERTRHDPILLDPSSAALERAAELEGARTMRLPSRAAHDAMVLAQHVPAAMLFVPSRGGMSHSPDEFTDPSQVELGMRVLAEALRQSAR